MSVISGAVIQFPVFYIVERLQRELSARRGVSGIFFQVCGNFRIREYEISGRAEINRKAQTTDDLVARGTSDDFLRLN